ncbi:MAG: energy-coupling factor ABC transporter ATP-binding protein [Halobacteriales archaeon]
MTVLSAEGLHVTGDGNPLLTDVTLSVAPGESVLVCGGPGSGKTLLLKALAGLFEDRDDLVVTGTVIRDSEIGYVFQYPATQLVRRTVRLDVGYGLENRGVPSAEIADRVEAIAEQFDATHLLDRRVNALSAGETTIAALLGVLVTEPDVVLLDEPFSTLDAAGTRQVLRAIDRLATADVAVVIAEHDARDLLSRVDRVLRLASGRVADDGPPRAVVDSLHRSGVKLPVRTQVAIERGANGERPVPLAADGCGVESP